MDVLDAELGAVLAVLEARLAGVHLADFVEVGPEGGGGGEVGGGDELDQIFLRGISIAWNHHSRGTLRLTFRKS
jgi:hypothetical protein